MLAKKLRDMHALAADSCDPEYNRALLEAAAEIERLQELKTPASRKLLNATKGMLEDSERECARLRNAVRDLGEEIIYRDLGGKVV